MYLAMIKLICAIEISLQMFVESKLICRLPGSTFL